MKNTCDADACRAHPNSIYLYASKMCVRMALMTREIVPKNVVIYADEQGAEPYTVWLDGLKDQKTRERIRVRIRRLESGLYGDCEPVGDGVSELRLFFGSGYRVYFGEDKGNIVILLCGGDKDTQGRDIEKAKELWKEHNKNV